MPRIAERWFETRAFADGVTLIWEPHVSTDLRCNMWFLRGRARNLLIDSGMGLRPLRAELAFLGEKPVTCLASHSHFDHSGGHHEFETRLCHAAEAQVLAAPTRANTLIDGFVQAHHFTALPYEGFDAAAYTIAAAPVSGHIDEGDVIDLGDRHFRVLHLPGHSPGSVALWEEKTATLYSGDVIYDGELYDQLDHSDIPQYLESMARLRELPVDTVHAGHFESFGRARLYELVDAYVGSKKRTL